MDECLGKAPQLQLETCCVDKTCSARTLLSRPRASRPLVCCVPVPGLIVTSALVIWKTLMVVTGSESPVCVKASKVPATD